MTTPAWMRDVSKSWPPDVRDRFRTLELSMTRDLMLYICNSRRGYPAEDGYQVLTELAAQDTAHREDLSKPDSFHSLAHLRLIAIAHMLIERDMRNAAECLRAAGHTWAEIADTLGCTRQAAQQRYGKKD